MTKQKIEQGTHPSSPDFLIRITTKGPYLVFGQPPFAMQSIMSNEYGESWYFREGRRFSTDREPTALCRCGASQKKPYCDGSHARHEWNPELTAEPEALLDHTESFEGDNIKVTSNRRYCVFSRFCEAAGGIRALTESDNTRKQEIAVREASMCPGGSLMAWSNRGRKPHEFKYEPSLGLIEDMSAGSSGGIWVRGGIRIEREDGTAYEIRNRNVLCRCGASSNKPYCDGTHASIRWHDGIGKKEEMERVEENA